MNYIEFYKQGNYPDEYNKSSYLDFEQKMYSWTLEKERENGKKPLPFKDTYNNKNNRTPYQIYTSQYKFKEKSLPYKSQMRQDLNDAEEGQNIAFLNKFYGPKTIGEYIPKVPTYKTKEALYTWVNKNAPFI
jgi:hypothetical protein